jgi:hypothetical protein
MRWWWTIVLLAVGAGSLPADEIAVVRVGDVWRYFKGIREASTPAAAWREVDFDDSSWLSGRSGLGFGGGDDATSLGDMYGRYTAVFARRKFTVADPTSVQWLVLRVDYADGFIAWLNGVEIARRGLPGEAGSPTPFDAVAQPRLSFGAEEIDVTAFAPLLVPGENVLAVQGHSASLFAFDFSLVPELLANFTRGPFLQSTSPHGTTIVWKTPVAADTAVDYGPTPDLGWSVADSALVTTHAVTLTNLSPDTRYFYRVRSAVGGRTATSPRFSFRTLKTHGPVRFLALADTGQGTLAQLRLADVLAAAEPDLVLHGGDVVYPYFTESLVDTKCLSVYGPHMRGTPYYFALGNHDLDVGGQAYLDTFFLPTNSVSGTEHYYSFDHGDAHFAVLYQPFLSQYKLTEGDAQYRWLVQDLSASAKPWKILLLHLPPQSSSAHRNDDLNFNGIPDRTEVKDVVLPVARRLGVQLILSGHEHLYERFNPTNGVHTVTTGGGGGVLYGLTQLDEASAQLWVRHHCVRVAISGDELRLEALDEAGVAFDSMTIRRALPRPRLYYATWHSPGVESLPANDGDGNVLGQTFDFAGEPIPTLPGEFSNLGRVFVNNDAEFLYVGFEQAMLYADNDVFLFIESPRQPGVPDLTGVGNGTLDADGEGADGLDCLANLAFTHFAPAIGCILGDEFADGQARHFARPRASFPAGQGVFRLDASLTDVPGARVQQFNRSPQTAPVPGEQNANFIEVAIPLNALGGAQPGDVIKIGAVVGGAAFDPRPDQQARELDRGFLGAAFDGGGLAPARLEGVSVWLAGPPDGPPIIHLSIQLDADGRRHLAWTARPGWKYQVEFARGLDGAFDNIDRNAFPRVATSTLERFELPAEHRAASAAAGFYRVRLVP